MRRKARKEGFNKDRDFGVERKIKTHMNSSNVLEPF